MARSSVGCYRWYGSRPFRTPEIRTQELAMADKQTDRSRSNGQEHGRPGTPEALSAAADVGAAAKPATASAPKKARKHIGKLTKELDRARATADKRMRQVEAAREKLEKREREAAAAATEVASIIGRIRDEAGSSAGSRVDAATESA